MPVCSRCGKTQATAELRRRKPPYTGRFVCKDECAPKAGLRVETPLGPGVVRNVATSRGKVTTVLVDLELHAGQRPEVNPESLWRAFKPNEVTA